jgi:hypothetical protein
MEFNYSYNGSSSVDNGKPSETNMSFVPDASREPTYFVGELAKNVEFREAISALHDVVVSDLRFKPKDKEEYKAWAAQQEQVDWLKVAVQREEVKNKIDKLQSELSVLEKESSERMKPFYTARKTYFDYLYKKNLDFWFVLDPVITVHPDEIFFECFSQDESTYGRLSASYEGFKNINQFSCGTTNIDYSEDLYQEFQKIRSYKQTFFQVDPSGFEVKTTYEDDFKEVKIDLPDSWVRGFLQVNSAMTLPSVKLDLDPLDVYNICSILRRNKEKNSPRSMKYILKPNEPIKIIFEPWGIELVCSRSVYFGNTEQEIRVWGRRRLLILERLIQITKKFTVYLLGTGMPSFYVADLGHMWFTLGLSGWTSNDWSKSGNFDLLSSRENVDDSTKKKIFGEMKKTWFSSTDNLSKKLGLDKSVILSSMGAYTQAGRAIYDLNKGVYRVRELSKDLLPMDKLRFSSPLEEKASDLIKNNAVNLSFENGSDYTRIFGTVSEGYRIYNTSITLDLDQKITIASCECNWYNQNKLYKGPCEHMLALKMSHKQKALGL